MLALIIFICPLLVVALSPQCQRELDAQTSIIPDQQHTRKFLIPEQNAKLVDPPSPTLVLSSMNLVQFFVEVIGIDEHDHAEICEGALIGPKKVLTAGNCVSNATSIEVRLGSAKKHQGDPVAVIYHYVNRAADLAVLILGMKTDAVVDVELKPIEIATQPVQPGDTCTVIGFSRPDDHPSSTLKQFPTTINSIKQVYEALQVNKRLSLNFIYAGMGDNIPTSDRCSGSPGSLLICHGKLAGIAAGTIYQQQLICSTPGWPLRFSDVYKMRHWIATF